jgi:hypothetical protein
LSRARRPEQFRRRASVPACSAVVPGSAASCRYYQVPAPRSGASTGHVVPAPVVPPACTAFCRSRSRRLSRVPTGWESGRERRRQTPRRGSPQAGKTTSILGATVCVRRVQGLCGCCAGAVGSLGHSGQRLRAGGTSRLQRRLAVRCMYGLGRPRTISDNGGRNHVFIRVHKCAHVERNIVHRRAGECRKV